MSAVAAWRRGVAGRKLWEFVEFRARRESREVTEDSLATFLGGLPEPAAEAFRTYAERIAIEARSPSFWQQDCLTFLDRVESDLDEALPAPWSDADEDLKFLGFEAVSSTLVTLVRGRGPVRDALQAGVRKSFPLSGVSLLIPIFMTWSLWSEAAGDATLPLLLGYFSAQCGYIVMAGGLFAGSFRAFGLKGRGKTIVAGVVLFALGTLAVNIGQ